MNKIIFQFILFFSSITLFAQNQGGGFAVQQGDISLTVIDSITGAPVEFATVALSLKDFDKLINGAVSDEKGFIKLENINNGKYVLTISYLGYKNKVIDTIKINPKRLSVNIGNVKIVPNDLLLKEVEIKGQAALIETKVDRIVYNAEKDLTAAGGNATDVLRKVPTLTVDLEGNVQMRGSSNIRVLINGKPSGVMSNNIADALRMIPADQIKNVEVITSPSAKYDAEGTAGIINIITKSKKVEGANGSINGSVGTRFINGSANFNYRKGKFGTTLSAGTNSSIPNDGTINFSREEYKIDTTIYFNQTGKNRVNRVGYNLGLGVDYDINKYNNIATNIRWSHFNFGTDGTINANTFSVPNSFNINSYRLTKNTFDNNGIDWSVDYKKTFEKQGQELSATVQLSNNITNNDLTTEKVPLSPTDFGLKYKSGNIGNNQEWTGQIDYIHPFTEKLSLETGLKSILRTISSDSKYELFDSLSNSYIVDPKQSNVLTYHQNVYAAYGVLSFPLPWEISAKGGLRWENTSIDGSFNNPELESIPNNNYNNFIPSINLSKTFAKIHNIKLSYTQRLQRPSLFYLNPFVNTADPRNISKGNPTLKPELSHLGELVYSLYYKQIALNASIYYRHTNDVIESYVDILPNNVAQTSFRNIGSNRSVGLNMFGSWQIMKPWTLRGNVNLYTYDINATAGIATNTNTNLMYNMALISSWAFNKGWSAEFFGMFNSPRYTSQGKNPSFSIYSVGFKKEFANKRASLGLSAVNFLTPNFQFKSDLKGVGFYQYTAFSIPFRSANINFSWQFGKMEFKGAKNKGAKNDDQKQGESQNF